MSIRGGIAEGDKEPGEGGGLKKYCNLRVQLFLNVDNAIEKENTTVKGRDFSAII